ncbi:hypothetical protein LPTSP4_00350 [Leptospira ryugenii]|uniref:HEAT repeat domain-containing protein n=1 Tax=Leptospira ryugenii TaxID=1917863 RepID=A0A2P2DV67_9LEPT|nr:hypothetical protein [Leptospira ryugenii]GBF48536.1 hypothetical protein LPTSP4_00350 [Leptospira ryugenii]
MKAICKIILILLITVSSYENFAQSLDTSTYQRIKSVLVQTGHQQVEELRTQVDRVTSEPVPYLKALVNEAGLRVYAKERAIMLLQYYPSADTEKFLEQKINDETDRSSVRTFAVKSYANGFYWRNQTKVEGFLKEKRDDSQLRTVIDQSLSEVKTQGIKKPNLQLDTETLQRNKK